MSDVVERLRNYTGADGYKRVLCAEAAAEIERLQALVKTLADDLADEIEGHYQGLKDYPTMKSRYERDMANVYVARRALEGK
jgi:hypothetical protein